MPQGICNAPATFQRFMEKCMGDLTFTDVLVYLDDLLVFSNTLEEHESKLRKVLDRLEEYGLKRSLEKCKFAQASVKCLGHVVSAKGVEPDPAKIDAVTSWPRPQNVKELKSFLGFTGYYRRFICNYSRLARPLNDLTKGYEPIRRKRGRKTASSTQGRPSPNTPFGEAWTTGCQEAFNALIAKLTSAPVLAYVDYALPFVLHTDASTLGLGAALYQEREGKLHPIAYASRGLSKSELNYPAHKLEFLALKWAITEKFTDYLYGAHFKVLTDNNPLTYVLSTAKLDATGHRWLAALANYNFNVQYRPGKTNIDADGLSRRPQAPPEDDDDAIETRRKIEDLCSRLVDPTDVALPNKAIAAVCRAHGIVPTVPVRCNAQGARIMNTDQTTDNEENPTDDVPLIESISDSPGAIPDEFINPSFPGQSSLPKIDCSQWVDHQKADKDLYRVIELKRQGNRPTSMTDESEDVKLLCRQWDKLILIKGVLHRKTLLDNKDKLQLVLPASHRDAAIKGLHDDVGHPGVERTTDLVRQRFFWPR
jgi:hypothetical protein